MKLLKNETNGRLIIVKRWKISVNAIIFIIVLSIVSTVSVYAILSSNSQSEGEKLDSSIIQNDLPITFDSQKKINATTYEEWKKSQNKMNIMKKDVSLTKEKISELYDSGYSLADIEKAEELSILCGMDVVEVLNFKYYRKDNVLTTSDKSWEMIEDDLSSAKNHAFNKLKIPKDKIKKLKNEHFTNDQIIEVGILALNYAKDYDRILKDFKSGKTYNQLDKEYWEERNNDLKNKLANRVSDQKDLENGIKNDYKISDEDIQLGGKYGINQIIEIGYAKNLAEKYKTSLKNVLELKIKEKNWNDVISALKEGIK